MESNIRKKNWINSLKGMFQGQDSRVFFISLRQRGERVSLGVREKLRVLRPDNERGIKG